MLKFTIFNDTINVQHNKPHSDVKVLTEQNGLEWAIQGLPFGPEGSHSFPNKALRP